LGVIISYPKAISLDVFPQAKGKGKLSMALEIPENNVSLCVQVIETVVCTPSTEHPYSTGDNRFFPENRDISQTLSTLCVLA